MVANAIPIHPETARLDLEVAEVLAVDGRRCQVSVAATTLEARTAASCLVQPLPGDRVALLRTAGPHGVYVCAVLERQESGPIGVSAPEGLCVSVPEGPFVVSAERIALIGRDSVALEGAQVNVDAKSLRVSFADLAALGRSAVAHIETVRTVGKHLSALWERVLQRSQRSYRVVEELEHVTSRQVDYRISETLAISSKNSLITAEELVKLDGKQLHLG